MIKYALIMFLSGRIYINRLIVTVLDVLCGYLLFNPNTNSELYIVIGLIIALVFFYMWIGYKKYFSMAKHLHPISVRITHEEDKTDLSYIYKNHQNEERYYPLPTKTGIGVGYKHYLMFIYLHLAKTLSDYSKRYKIKDPA